MIAVPSTVGSLGYLKGVMIILAALLFPWILFAIWSAVITSAINEEIKEHDAERESDFV